MGPGSATDGTGRHSLRLAHARPAHRTLTAELSRSTAINRQGMIMGLNQSLMSGANISAPLISGALIGHRLFVSWALAMAAIAAIGAAQAGQLLDTPRTR
jgi:MFS family permease